MQLLKKMFRFQAPPLTSDKRDSLMALENKLEQLKEQLHSLEQIETRLRTNLKETTHDPKTHSKM